MKRKLYVRCGDGDNYNGFEDIRGAIEYLQDMGVSQTLKTFNKMAVESPEYQGHNHISIYWGYPDEPTFIRSVTPAELQLINDNLRRKPS